MKEEQHSPRYCQPRFDWCDRRRMKTPGFGDNETTGPIPNWHILNVKHNGQPFTLTEKKRR